MKQVTAVQQWPLPQNIRALRGLLGLAGYYRQFVKDFAQIASPLHRFLSKAGFVWNESELRWYDFDSFKRPCVTPLS